MLVPSLREIDPVMSEKWLWTHGWSPIYKSFIYLAIISVVHWWCLFDLFQTMKRRERVVLDSEKDFWKEVKSELMSEEEAGDEVILKTPGWRAPELNNLIKALDERLKERGHMRKLVKRMKRSAEMSSRRRPIDTRQHLYFQNQNKLWTQNY